jgi:hypothetical protein
MTETLNENIFWGLSVREGVSIRLNEGIFESEAISEIPALEMSLDKCQLFVKGSSSPPGQ